MGCRATSTPYELGHSTGTHFTCTTHRTLKLFFSPSLLTHSPRHTFPHFSSTLINCFLCLSESLEVDRFFYECSVRTKHLKFVFCVLVSTRHTDNDCYQNSVPGIRGDETRNPVHILQTTWKLVCTSILYSVLYILQFTI